MRSLATFLTAVIVLAGVVSFVEQTNPPPVLEGFTWQDCRPARLSILKPDRWRFREAVQDGVYACSISKENVDQFGPFRTGLMVNYMTDVKERTGLEASQYGAKFVAVAEEKFRLLLKEAPSINQVPDYGDIRVFTCRVRSPFEREYVIQHFVLLADDRAGNVHTLYFESPEDEWDDAWKIGKVMLDNLQFRFERLDDEVAVGDMVVITARGGARLKVGITVLATVERGEQFIVDKVRGAWLGVTWKGEPGWVYRRDVRPMQQAVEFFSEVIRSEPTAGNYLYRGLASAAIGDYARAIRDINKSISIKDDVAAVWYARGDLWRVTGEENRAFDDYSEAIRLDPEHAGAYHNRGMIWFDRGDDEKAIADLTETLRLESERAVAFSNRGLAYRRKGDLPKAIADLTEALRLAPEHAPFHENRGLTWKDAGELDKAIADYTAAIRFDPKLTSAYVSRGDAFARKGDAAKAMEDYEEALRLDPNSRWAYNGRGHLWRQQGEFRKAIADYTDVIRLDPTYAPAFNNRAVSYTYLGQMKQAMVDYDEAIRLDPDFAEAYRDRGACRAEAGKYAEAMSDFNKAIQLNPRDPASFANRGMAYCQQGDQKRGIEDLKEACRLHRDSIPRLKRVAVALASAGQHRHAIACLTAVIDAQPSDASAYVSRGSSWQQTGEYAKATADYKRSLELNSRDPAALAKLAWLQATCPDMRYRNGEQAVLNAKAACELTQWKEASRLDTLAAGYAEDSDFDSAVKWQKKALEFEPSDDDMRARLSSYESGRPYREAAK